MKNEQPLVSGRMCNRCHGHRLRNRCWDCERDFVGSHWLLRGVMLFLFVPGFFILVANLAFVVLKTKMLPMTNQNVDSWLVHTGRP